MLVHFLFIEAIVFAQSPNVRLLPHFGCEVAEKRFLGARHLSKRMMSCEIFCKLFNHHLFSILYTHTQSPYLHISIANLVKKVLVTLTLIN